MQASSQIFNLTFRILTIFQYAEEAIYCNSSPQEG